MRLEELLAFLRKRPGAWLGLAILGVQIIAIALAPELVRYSPIDADPLSSLQPPSADHWFGTDVAGMDIYARVVYATRINLLISIVAVACSFAIGTPIGLLIGFYRSRLSALTMRLFDFIQSFPVFVLGMAFVSVLGQQIWNVALALGVLFVPMFARLIRAETLSLRERPFVNAARCNGATDRRSCFAISCPMR